MTYKTELIEKGSCASLQNLFSVYTFISRCCDWSVPMMDEMSLSDDLSSRTCWRRVVMHLCRTFLVFPYSYQDVAIDRFLWWMKWVYLMTYQAELIEEGSLCIFAKPFQCFHIHIKVWQLT